MIRRFLQRWFAPPTPPPPLLDLLPRFSPQPSCERDWTAGDRAECIAPGAWVTIGTGEPSGPKRGDVLRVLLVFADQSSVWLVFSAWPGMAYPAGHFRKLRPCSADFREQLRQRAPVGADGRRTRTPAPAPRPEPVE